MKVAILGTGQVGRTLGAGWVRAGHPVVFGARDPEGERARQAAAATGAPVVTLAAAAAQAEVVVLAVPWAAAAPLVTALRASLAGKVVIDATNPIAPGLQLAVGHTTSGAEVVAQAAPEARVVKAFNTTGWEVMAAPAFGAHRAVMLVCGDDAEARALAAGLARELGFDAVEAGALSLARLLEPLALLWIQLARTPALGRRIAFALLRDDVEVAP